MKKLFTLLLLAIISSELTAQTGPGGVGNATSNVLWLKPDSITNLADDADIAIWSDVSGNGNDLSQPVSTFTPIFKENIVNGQPVVRFNKSNGRIRRTNFTGFPTTAITEIYVNKTTDSGDGILSYASAGGHNDLLIYNSNNISLERNSVNATGVDVNDNNFHIVNISWQSTGGQEEVWKDGDNSYNDTGNATGSAITTGGSFAIAGEQDAPDASYESNQAHFGDFGEVIIFNTYLNKAQHIIISNYLAAKYGLSLSDNDFYNEDDVANGNFDTEVAGIGRVDVNNIHDNAKGTAIVQISNPSNLDDDEFLLWGHDNGIQFAIDYTDVPTGVQARFERIWRASEVNASNTAVDVGTINVSFDLNNLGYVDPTDLRLLVDTDNDGVFNDETPISGATDIGGGIYQFTAVSAIANNLRFTLATINVQQTQLPVELLSFTAKSTKSNQVNVEWQTATEINNDFFTVERSENAEDWEFVQNVIGAGNSSKLLDYAIVDTNPLIGLSYYRLKQTDFNGEFEYSDIKTVNISEKDIEVNIYPNPAKDLITIEGSVLELQDIKLYSAIGKDMSNLVQQKKTTKTLVILDISKLKEGIYYVKTKTTANRLYVK